MPKTRSRTNSSASEASQNGQPPKTMPKKTKNSGDWKIHVAPVVVSTPTSSKASTPASSATPSPAASTTTATTTTTTTSNTEVDSFKYTVRNIPPQFSTQKSFYTVLCTHLGLRNFQLTVNFNKTALLITQFPITETVIQKLKISTNSKDISVTPINKKTQYDQAAYVLPCDKKSRSRHHP
jgi:hypothetical protein